MNRQEQIAEAAKIAFEDNVDMIPTISGAIMGLRFGFALGAEWADEHPNGFINYFPNDKSFTNKEFQELLQQYPEDAVVCIECCNPRAMVYDEKNNLIRID